MLTECWVAVVKPGRVMFEIEGVTEEQAREAMRLAMHKLPVKSKFAIKEEKQRVVKHNGIEQDERDDRYRALLQNWKR